MKKVSKGNALTWHFLATGLDVASYSYEEVTCLAYWPEAPEHSEEVAAYCRDFALGADLPNIMVLTEADGAPDGFLDVCVTLTTGATGGYAAIGDKAWKRGVEAVSKLLS